MRLDENVRKKNQFKRNYKIQYGYERISHISHSITHPIFSRVILVFIYFIRDLHLIDTAIAIYVYIRVWDFEYV